MAAYRRVYDLRSPAGWLPVHRDQLRAQRSVSSMGSLYLIPPLAMARSSSDDNAVCYVLPVLQMTSCFHTMSKIQIEAWSLQHSKLFTVTSQVVLLNYALRDKVCYCLVITLGTHPTPVFQSTSQQYAFRHFPHCDKNKKWQHRWKLMNIPTFSGMLACRRTWQTLLLFRK